MGMVDRGADLSWLSQYPHEKEVLLPPLTGLEALEHSVEGGVLVIQSRLSLNMAAHTLEQVLSRRRKMLMDMAKGIELELRDALGSNDDVCSRPERCVLPPMSSPVRRSRPLRGSALPRQLRERRQKEPFTPPSRGSNFQIQTHVGCVKTLHGTRGSCHCRWQSGPPRSHQQGSAA